MDKVQVEGAWLQQQIISRGRRKNGKVYFNYENEQRYSNYKKFRADTKLLVDGPNLP